MSLVGPRPKLQEYVTLELPCRPGITGMATIVFACEGRFLARVAKEHLNAYIHAVILPAKQQIDAAYMARATFLSDLSLLVNTLLHRWDTATLEKISGLPGFATEPSRTPSRVFPPAPAVERNPIGQAPIARCSPTSLGFLMRDCCGYSISRIGIESEATSASWIFPLRGPQRQVFVAGVEVKSTSHATW